MADAHDAKYQEMQKYVPFIQRVIEKLKVNNDQPSDNPRKAQLQKMEMLYDLLTNKHKKIKIETLTKCEGVLIKLQTKIEKNEDSILNDVKLKQQSSSTASTATNKSEDMSGPASPPPEVIPDDLDQPVVIPTERRCSPILDKKDDISEKHKIKKSDAFKQQDSLHSSSEDIHRLRKTVFNLDSKADSQKFHNTTKQNSSSDKNVLLPQKPYHDSCATKFEEQRPKHSSLNKQSSHLPKEKNVDAIKSTISGQKLQTVKVVITEPLPPHFKQQHFPPSSKFLPRSSVCHNNLRSLQHAVQTNVDKIDVYSPEELWNQYNEKHTKNAGVKSSSTAPVFSRLGTKVDESPSGSPSTSKISGRYTPIPDVLKSPPLSVSDINNLLLESGSDKILNDISEIGSRRPHKNQDNQNNANNSFEYVRRKLAQTAKMNSPRSETPSLRADKDVRNVSPLTQERIALKYNPHPRQERLQSVSSTDGSECSFQSKINDPRIKLKLQTSSLLHSPTQVAPSNVNVLPAINLSDPRLKKQNTPSTPNSFTSAANIDFLNQNPISYATRKDPRISRVGNNNNNIPSIQTTPTSRISTNKCQYSSEENWDSDEDANKPPIKTGIRLEKTDEVSGEGRGATSFAHNRSGNGKVTPNGRDSLNQSRFQLDSTVKNVLLIVPERETSSIAKSCSPNIANAKQIEHTEPSVSKLNVLKDTTISNNKLIPNTTFVVPQPPKSESEEDWDSEPDVATIKPKLQIQTKIDSPQLAISKSPVVSTQISPKAFVNPKYISTASASPIHVPQNSHTQPQYSIAGSNIHHTQRMQSSVTNNRFNSVLNDKSERIKYFEAKKQKANEPRTYREFREAKERALAQEAAIKKAADEAEAKKRADELKQVHKHKDTRENINVKKEKQITIDTSKNLADKKEKKSFNKDNKKPSAGSTESTLDKMYRTQNFNTNFPKANTSFKIPKKKTEDKTKEEATKQQTITLADKIKPSHQADTSTDKIKPTNHESNDTANTNESINNYMDPKQAKHTTSEQLETIVCDKSEEKGSPTQSSEECSTKQKTIDNKTKENSVTEEKQCTLHPSKQTLTKQKPIDGKAKENSVTEENQSTPQPSKEILTKEKPIDDNAKEKSATEEKENSVTDEKQSPPQPSKETLTEDNSIDDNAKEKSATEDISSKNQIENIKIEEQKVIKEKSQENTHENNLNKLPDEDNKLNLRDPRCRLKTTLSVTETAKEKNNDEDRFKIFENIVITSSENQVFLKPQNNLDKFNQFTHESTPKPQRILRRRNTMVVFDSAPLVDKDKLKKANALLFEDVQEEEKRKRKQAEDDRLAARRNKHLEEMFRKTDDNCTVSTQNIITGKRRTRATINFNETANAKNVFKHITVKDNASLGNVTTNSPVTQTVKPTKSKFKIKIKNLGHADPKISDESDDETLETIAKREAKRKEIKGVKIKSSKEVKICDRTKTEESESEHKKDNKFEMNRAAVKSDFSSKNAPKDIQNDEHQNCAVSSTSTDNCTTEETTCSSTSTNRSFKKETDDNEPTSTANKSNNSTTSVEPYEPVLHEIVDQILTPNANRGHIFDVLSQILSDEKLELIKSLIESSNKQNEDQQDHTNDDKHKQSSTVENDELINVAKTKINNSSSSIKVDEIEEDEQEDRKPLKSTCTKVAGGKKITMPKKKRTELDRLNEDIRDMFICNGVITATGRRMCTIMGKDISSTSSRKSTKETTPSRVNEQDSTKKLKEEILKPKVASRTLRRSLRCFKTTDENEDTDSILSRTSEESIEDLNDDLTPQRKMPVLKPHTPIKMPHEALSTKEIPAKRKSNRKCGIKSKKVKTNNADSREEDAESDENESETEVELVVEDNEEEGQEEAETENNNKQQVSIKNTNIHWHNQSKYTTWCMICEKRIFATSSSVHYKNHHGENYIARMAPVLLQQFKQGKLNKPLFGVKRIQKQTSWFYRCPFCLKYLNAPLALWLEHFQNHTIEYRYECSKCHRTNNRKMSLLRHMKSCEGATIVTSPVKLSAPTTINAHVCHLCNFIQLKRDNLERHYIEQHHVEQKTVDLLGYTIKLFDVQNVECVNEKNAVEREKQAWKCIEQDEKVIDIDDDETSSTSTNKNSTRIKNDAEDDSREEKDKTTQRTNETIGKKNKTETKTICLETKEQDNKNDEEKISNSASTDKDNNLMQPVATIEQADREFQTKQTIKLQDNKKDPSNEKLKKVSNAGEKAVTNENFSTKIKQIKKKTASNQDFKKAEIKPKKKKTISISDLTECQSNDFEVIDEEVTVQNIQDELLALAAKAAEKENENQNNNTTNDEQGKTTMSDIISSSIDMIYNRDSATTDDSHKSIDVESSLPGTQICTTASNVFMPTRDESNYSPTIQILAQSIINIEEQGNDSVKDKPITMAERLSQRFKDLQADNTISEKPNIISSTILSPKRNSNGNAFEKLINDTLLELTKEKDSASNKSVNQIPPEQTSITKNSKENVYEKLFSETVMELENDDEKADVGPIAMQQEQVPATSTVTVISDDEDWEDIEITETAPSTSTATAGNIQKSKSKGLFQKFGVFKGNNIKSKKHLTPMVFLPKKKQKEKSPHTTTLLHSPITVAAATPSVIKHNEITTTTSITSTSTNKSTHCNAHLGFKPVVNIMDGLFPDSPCNDPIDLVPELAPLEPLQDLNDISSILDSNLSAVNINASDNHTSIEDALDFISEQQANEKEKSDVLSVSIMCSHAKNTPLNNISNVGFSVQSGEENSFKFYCLLQNCSFLYSSDSVGLETHFMCEHSHIKWNGYCAICESKNIPNNNHINEEYSISKEIRHMMEKHANKTALDLNTDSTQHSTSSSHDNDERPKIKIRRLTGDCLSRATPENIVSSNEIVETNVTANTAAPLSLLGALLVAEPKPPTKEMPPQPQMPLTEPILLSNNTENSSLLPFRNVNSDFLITAVTSAGPKPNQTPLQISNVISLNSEAAIQAPTTDSQQIQVPKISNVRTLAPKAGNLWTPHMDKESLEVVEVPEESLEVSSILQNAQTPLANIETSRSTNDSPVLVAETVPLAQSKTGDFVVTQTVSAQYNEFSSTALGFNISIASSAAVGKTNPDPPISNNSASIASRQYKCMGTGCKFVSRVPVAMSDHLRFHERRNFSNKQDYLVCGFCFYCASDVEDYMKHANQYHIINKGSAAPHAHTQNESDTASSLTKKIQNILNTTTGSSGQPRYTTQNQTTQVQDTQEVYLKKLRETIDEIVGPTGLADDKLYRCVVKNCHTQLTESTFLSHIMYHISSAGSNPNNYLFKCPHCTAQYHRPAGIKAHIKNHARNRYFCYLCDETSTNPGQLLKHFSEKHWHTLNMYTKELLQPKLSIDGSESIIDSSYYVAYTQDLSSEEVRKFGEKLILEWQRKKSGSKTHFKSTEIDLLPLSAIFQRQVNCGECEYKTKVRTNMFRHLLMHKQNPGLANKTGTNKVSSVDPVNPVPCLNSSERFFDKMTNLASSSLIPSASGSPASKPSYKLPQCYIEESKRFACGCQGCTYHTISEDLFRTHLLASHSTALTYTCTFCKEEICKRGITLDRIMNHTRFHGPTIYRCEECNYAHHMRYVVERHVNEKHSAMKVNIVTHNRSSEDSVEGSITKTPFAGKKYKETVETNQTAQTSTTATTRSTAAVESSGQKPAVTYVNSSKGKCKWTCDVCGHRTSTVGQMQTHCQQQHSVKNQYKCAHCNFGSQQLSQILHHIDEKHSGKTREARSMYHKTVSGGDETADTRPLWQRNDPTRVRHIRGILMEDEEESEEYRKKLALTEDVDDESNEDHHIDSEGHDEDLNGRSYVSGYEFGCYHCSFKTQTFEELKNQHYAETHNCQLASAKPFWYRMHRRLCCPECLSFLGNYSELQQHLQNTHKKRFYAADLRMAENDDTSQRILCGYCSCHCANADQLYRHHLRAQHWPQDIRIDNNEQIREMVALGKTEVSYQCTLCADIFSNRVAIVQHVCNVHAGEDSFSFRELTNALIYRCNSCCFTSTTEAELFRHAIDHYSRFKVCSFCKEPQTSFIAYMQHCYAEHRNDILKFRSIYPLNEIRKFLLQTLVIFPNGLVLNKRNLLNTKYGETGVIEVIYEDIYKISQQPPIPRISIARLVARKSIEFQQKQADCSPTLQADVMEAMQPRPKGISKRRCTVAFSQEDHNTNNTLLKPKIVIADGNPSNNITIRRTTADNDQQEQQDQKHMEFNVPLKCNKISKRRRTVAVDHETLFCSNFMSSTNSLLTEIDTCEKKRKISSNEVKEVYPLNLDMEPFSFYGQTSKDLDLSKIYTKVAIGGVRSPITIDKFKLLFDIDCQLKLTKCDEDRKLLAYNDYKHIKKACPASQKLRHN